MIAKNTSLKYIFILLVLSYFFFIFGNGILSLTNPDEVFYAQTAKEMVKYKSWMTPYLFDAPQFEKPILLYWLLRASFIIFGINSFSARFPPALFATLGIIAVYLLSLLGFKNEKKAFLSSLILMSSGFYVGLARTVFTDMVFSIFILFALLAFFWGYSVKKKGTGLLLFFLFSGLAVLTKGPLGILIPLFTIVLFLFVQKEIKYIFSREFLLGSLIFLALSLPWYLLMIKKYGSSFTHEFFYNDHIRRIFEAEHAFNDTWYFYPVSMIICIFPWSLYVIAGGIYLFRQLRQKAQNTIYVFLATWICATFLIFQFAHSKLASYIFPLFPALALLAADFIYDFAKNNAKKSAIFFLSIGTFLAMALIPVGMLVALNFYKVYLSSKILIFIPVISISILSLLFLNFVLKRNFIKSSYLLMFLIPVILFFIPFVHEDIEPYLSSQYTCEYLEKNYSLDGKIIASKFFARGVRYYTDKEIAVMSMGGNNFFSPHPVIFLDTDPKTREFLRTQPVTYCVVKKSYAQEDIPRLADKEFKCTLLKVMGNEYLIRIEPN